MSNMTQSGEKMVGRLYGVGVGPGDPELLTLRAHHVLSQVPVIFVPKKTEQSESIAESIVGSLTPRFDRRFAVTEKMPFCPACGKSGKSRQAVLLHFRKAMEGWDPIWDRSMPHSRWAQAHGLKKDGSFVDVAILTSLCDTAPECI